MRRAASAAVAILSILPPLHAQTPTTAPAQTVVGEPVSRTADRREVIRASELIGLEIRDDRGTSLGRVHDVIADFGHGRVLYVLAELGGFAGFGDRRYALPWRSFRVLEDRRGLLLVTPRERLGGATIPPQHDHTWGDRQQARRVYVRVGVEPYWGEGDEALRVARLARSEHTPVTNPDGEDLGRIEELMLDTRDGRLAYGILRMVSPGLPVRNVAVPWAALRLDAGRKTYVLNTERATLDAIAFPDRDTWPDLADEGYARPIHTRLQATPYWEVAATDRRGDAVDFRGAAVQTIEGRVTAAAPGRVTIQTDDSRTVIVEPPTGTPPPIEGDRLRVTGPAVTLLRADRIEKQE